MVETVKSDHMSPHSNPEFEDSKPIFLHDTLAHDDPGFLHLDETGDCRHPYLRMSRDHHETLEGRVIHKVQNKG